MSDERHSVRDDAIRDGTSDAPTARTGVSRRSVLRGGASAVAGGALLTGVAGRGRATPHGGNDRPLDVRTTDVEVLGNSDGETDRAKTFGHVDGMDRVNCRRCKVGAQVARAGHDEWYGGLQRVVVARSSFRVAVTLAGLRPGEYQFRLVACPVTHDHLCFGNTVTIVIRQGGREKHKKKKHKKKREHGKKKKRKKKHDRCPCDEDHDEDHHLTLCSDDWDAAREYAFAVSGDHVRKSGRSCEPNAVGHDAVTINASDAISGRIVTGALAGGGDSFLFDGDVTDLRCDGGVRVYLDGDRFDGY